MTTGRNSSSRCVPNEFPKVSGAPYRVAVIGEAPGADEDQAGRPFCGASGRFLDSLLTSEGLSRMTVFVGNICNYRPPDNNFTAYHFAKKQCLNRPELLESLERLSQDLTKFNPNVCVLLGNIPLYFASGEWRPISEWQGAVFVASSGPFKGRKCIPTYHPAYLLRGQYHDTPLVRNALAKAAREGLSPDHVVPKRTFRTGLPCSEIESALEGITMAYDLAERDSRPYPELWVSFDLEGYWNRVTRFSFATSPVEGFIVPITSGEYDSYWSVAEECRIWREVARTLGDKRIPKVLQNSLYDRFVLAYLYKILITNVAFDTMLGHWELYCELPNNLGLQASIYTVEPYWKDNRTNDDLHTREIYCCKDSAVTDEIRLAQTPLLEQNYRIWNHFQFNLRLLNPVLFMELRGLKYDSAAASEARKKVLAEMWVKKHELNVIAGRSFVGTRQDLLSVCCEKIVKKREAKYLMSFGQLPLLCLKNYEEAAKCISILDTQGLLGDSELASNAAVLGELEYWLDLELNVDSSPQMQQWLYVERRYERQYKLNPKTRQQQLSTDVMAMLNLYRKTPTDHVPKLILQIRSLLYQAQILAITSDPDGRVRCGYNEVAAETGRIACYESPTGSGYNLQTVTKKLRYLFRADDGHWLGQCDLAGADGWTVAAHCKSLGDSTMLDDYLFGLKPARIIALMYMELESEVAACRLRTSKEPTAQFYQEVVARISQHFNSLSRAELKSLSSQVDSNGWLYFGSKRVQHGSNYGAKPPTVSDIILKDSHKFLGEPTYVSPKICSLLQTLYLNRYVGISRWHTRIGATLLQRERLVSASGRVRRFFGRMRDGREINHDTLKAALSNEPQDNTTYATNLAVYRLWHDSSNRDRSRRSGLVVEPLHQVHDAMITQWPKEATEWAIVKHKEWLDNELVIAGIKVKIPYEGAYGASWGELDQGVI